MEIVSNSQSILNQLIDVVKSMTEKEYILKLNVLNKSSIGQHIRHIIEFYIEFEKGYELGTISYDKRIRNLEFEVNQNRVVSEIETIISNIKKYNLEKELLIESNHGLNENDTIFSKSSCRREIVYALDHTVHHLAIIKIAIQVEFKHINIASDLGIAPSTLRNIQKTCVQ